MVLQLSRLDDMQLAVKNLVKKTDSIILPHLISQDSKIEEIQSSYNKMKITIGGLREITKTKVPKAVNNEEKHV